MNSHFDTVHFCPFARAILKGQTSCHLAISAHIAERHNIHCTQKAPSARCQLYIEATYARAKFTLQTNSTLKALPSGKKTKLQIGLLTGLQHLLPDDAIQDIDTLLTTISQRYPDIQNLPYTQIMPHIANCKPRSMLKT